MEVKGPAAMGKAAVGQVLPPDDQAVLQPGAREHVGMGVEEQRRALDVQQAGAGPAEHCVEQPGAADGHDALGAGEQARLQLKALCLVRPIEGASVWARDIAKARQCAAELSTSLGIAVSACTSIDEALEGADIAITTTPSREPLIRRHHLRPGLHITAMGSDAEHKNEIAAEALAAVDSYVADRLSQTRVLGELHHALEAGAVGQDADFAELGQVIAGLRQGRRRAEDITLCDLTGTGAQDTAIAGLAFQRAQRMGKGFKFHS